MNFSRRTVPYRLAVAGGQIEHIYPYGGSIVRVKCAWNQRSVRVPPTPEEQAHIYQENPADYLRRMSLVYHAGTRGVDVRSARSIVR